MREKIVLIGAGSALFTRGLISDMLTAGLEADLVLVDVDPTALNAIEKLARKMIAARHSPIRVQAATDRRAALPQATVVICTIAVGGRPARRLDVEIPRRHGIYQPVGDSIGPGGTVRALRMVPAMIAIAQDVLDLAPQALLFNYANPMAVLCRAVRQATGAPIIGLCHGVDETARYLARSLDQPTTDLSFTAVGVNHLTWFLDLRRRGQDLMPVLRQTAAAKVAAWQSRHDASHQIAAAVGPRLEDADVGANPLCWNLLHFFGAFPSALDRHVAEFFPAYLGKDRYYDHTLGIDAYDFDAAVRVGEQRYEQTLELADSDKPLGDDFFKTLEGEHEQVVRIITDLRRGTGTLYHVNLPNCGQVPNLPADVIVESPATAAGFEPVPQPPLPTGLIGPLATHLAWVELTVEAARTGSRHRFIQALMTDGCVDSIETAVQLADDLLQAHADHLPQFDTAPIPG